MMLLCIPNTVAMISPMTNGTAAANTASSMPAFFCSMTRDQNLARTMRPVKAPSTPQSITRPGPRVTMSASICGGSRDAMVKTERRKRKLKHDEAFKSVRSKSQLTIADALRKFHGGWWHMDLRYIDRRSDSVLQRNTSLDQPLVFTSFSVILKDIDSARGSCGSRIRAWESASG